ncbi:hypothetical protein GGR51DRAFT_540303 [Nemania sp. FL0031]|nr:hypothetical protein GGR51DRAFT_540303 [Nemania sp. FL0031]
MRVTNTKPWQNEFSRRFFCGEPSLEISTINKGEQVLVYHFFDWDARRDYYVVTSENFLEGMDHDDIQTRVWNALERYLPFLSPTARLIMIDDDRRLQAVFSNPADLIGIPDGGFNTPTPGFEWPRFEDVTQVNHLPTINRSQMTEVDRVAPRVDIMKDTSRGDERIVAKWLLVLNADFVWREMLLLNSIPAHPHIVPIYRIIVDDASGRILGWASKYVDGSDLEADKSRFKMKWLRQLLETVDYLHLELGITHGDLQLKNMLVDKATDKLLLIDFEEANQIDEERLRQELNQLTWSIYEIVTHDVALVEERLFTVHSDDEAIDDDPRIINEMSEWPARANLDCEPQELRQFLQSWIQRRAAMPIVLLKTALQMDEFNDITQFPKASPAVEQKRQVRKTKFEHLLREQALLQAEKNLLQVGEMRWERLPSTRAYPNRTGKAIDQSNKKRKAIDCEGDAPPPKKSRYSVTMTPYTEDLESSEEETEPETHYITLKLPSNYLNKARKKHEITEKISIK